MLTMPHPMVINRNVLEMEYAVRGPLAQRAAVLKREGREIIPCHLGNPQALGQRPISFYRQVLGLVEEPARIERERRLRTPEGLAAGEGLPESVLETAETVLSGLETGLGAYTETGGPWFIREAIARYIDDRDGPDAPVKADAEAIFLTNGASEGVRFLLEMLIADSGDGIMIPIPQYPLYSATIVKNGGALVGYYPEEDAGWALSRAALEESIDRARGDGVQVKAIVVINPGNPTGAILDEASIEEVIEFAQRHGLAILADEVYQENLYGGDEFVSFARALGKRDIPLFSLHSTSKGFYGECGHRGGYVEVRNGPQVAGLDGVNFVDVLRKQASVNLCSNTVGQVLTYLMVSPPEPGTDSGRLFEQEKRGILDDLHGKATRIRQAFTEMEGMECFGRIGAMYLFPRLGTLPPGTTDFDYCMSLLEATGLSTVNGSGFGQKEGTQHLRVAFLPSREVLEAVLPRWIEFHNRYVTGRG
jgi:aspartate/methionine/tyrosine aminotransferase